MIVAGIGCRRTCPAAAIVALVEQAGPVDILAAPAWKQDEPGLLEAARLLGLPLRFVGEQALSAVQGECLTRSAVVSRAVGMASVAEAAALAGGGTLLRPRFGDGWATCAVARHPACLLPLHPTSDAQCPCQGGGMPKRIPPYETAELCECRSPPAGEGAAFPSSSPDQSP